jgi:glycosyltransferase involved in cell wall biosynthesis
VNPLISVVVPAHNEAAGIANAVAEIERNVSLRDVRCEIIVVDDGSRDGTYEVVQALAAANPVVRGVKLSRNFGKEAALLAGLESAAGDAIITIDADLQHPPATIPQMIDAWRAGAKVVHAVKADRGEDSFVARTRAAAFNRMLTALGGVDIRHSSDFKLLDRVAASVIALHLHERKRFYRGLAQWIGFSQVTLSFDVAPRFAGKSSWSVRSLLGLALTALVSFTSAPLRLVTFLGLATFALGLVVGVEALWSWMHGRSVSGFATLIITQLIVGSTIMISLGIIGEYIAKIYDELKGRPIYIAESRCGVEADGRMPRVPARRINDLELAGPRE